MAQAYAKPLNRWAIPVGIMEFPNPRRQPRQPLPLDVTNARFVQEAVTNIVLANMNVAPEDSAVYLACGDHTHVPFILKPDSEEE